MNKNNLRHIYDARIQKELFEKNYFHFDLTIKDNSIKLEFSDYSIPSKRLESIYFKTAYKDNVLIYETYELFSNTEFNNALEDLLKYAIALDITIPRNLEITM